MNFGQQNAPSRTSRRGKQSVMRALAEMERTHGLDAGEDKGEIADIITFCNHPRLLALPTSSNMKLFLAQRVVLKCLYMGSRGNETLRLDQEEMQWLYDRKQDDAIAMVDRFNRGDRTRISELTMVLGRRSGKTTIASIISAYELYKILKVGGGDPYRFYDMPVGAQIAVINVATQKDQAGILFAEIKNRLRYSPFFADRIASTAADRIRIYTDIDLARLDDKTLNIPVEGSIFILCGHSNYDALRGFATICLLFDELAFYDESDKVSGREFYNALKPSAGGFKGADGIEDGITVEISTPGPKTGIFYKLWDSSHRIQSMLSFQVPTWEFNPKRPYDDPELVKAREFDPGAFDVEFGAQWPEGSSYGLFFPEALVRRAVLPEVIPDESPDYRCEYYFHLDPALNSNRYVLVAVKKSFTRGPGAVLLPVVTLGFTRCWMPKGPEGIDYMEVDRDLLRLCQEYRPVVVSFDRWNSESSIQMLRMHGVQTVKTAFNRGYKQKIYFNLRELMQRDPQAVRLYDHQDLLDELLNLKYRPTPRGQSIGADPRSDVPNDDYADCLAGATFMASGNFYARLPSIVTVPFGVR